MAKRVSDVLTESDIDLLRSQRIDIPSVADDDVGFGAQFDAMYERIEELELNNMSGLDYVPNEISLTANKILNKLAVF